MNSVARWALQWTWKIIRNQEHECGKNPPETWRREKDPEEWSVEMIRSLSN